MEGQDFRPLTESCREAASDPSDFPCAGKEGKDTALGLIEKATHSIGKGFLPSPRGGDRAEFGSHGMRRAGAVK